MVRDIGPRGAVIAAFPQDHQDNMAIILQKPWPDAVKQQLIQETDPLLLVLPSDMSTFAPSAERYAIVSIPREGHEAAVVLRELVKRFRAGEDVIGELTRDQGIGRRVWRQVSSAVVIEPGACDVSVDLKKLFGRRSR